MSIKSDFESNQNVYASERSEYRAKNSEKVSVQLKMWLLQPTEAYSSRKCNIWWRIPLYVSLQYYLVDYSEIFHAFTLWLYILFYFYKLRCARNIFSHFNVIFITY